MSTPGGHCPLFWPQQAHCGCGERTNGGGCGRGIATRAGEKSAANAAIKGPWARRAAKGRPRMPLGRDNGRGVSRATIAHKKSDLVHVPPGFVHVRGGVQNSIFFNEFVPPGRIEGITGGPWRVLPPPMPSEGGVLRSASSAHVPHSLRCLFAARCACIRASSSAIAASRFWTSCLACRICPS